jgi:hypothetical protein
MDMSHDHTYFGAKFHFWALSLRAYLVFFTHINITIENSRSMATLILEPQIRFRARMAYFQLFDPQKYIFSCFI